MVLRGKGGLQQAQLPGADDRLSAILHLQLVENFLVIAFDGAEGQEKPPADLTIRESLGSGAGFQVHVRLMA
jgi:hypothetical protein